MEDQDQSIIDTALREAEEEVGIVATSINVIGQLTDLYIPVSNFNVYPTVGYINYAPTFLPQLSEVKSIIEVPFTTFLDPAYTKVRNISINKHITLNRVPYFDAGGKVIWGATAMIMSELIQIAKN